MRFVAVGDSFTEGIGDEQPDGSVRGWADLVAQGIADATQDPVGYCNLAVRGRKLEPIVREQIPAALALDPLPTLITFNGGGNDMLRPGMEVASLVALTEEAVRQCQRLGVEIVLLAGPDPSNRLPLGGKFRARGDELTAAVRVMGQRYGLRMIDLFHDDEIKRAGYWSEDRLHLGPAGHARAAKLVLAGLGYADEPVATQPDSEVATGARAEFEFYRAHVAPWVRRRIAGRSSGDGRTGKHSNWVQVAPNSSATY